MTKRILLAIAEAHRCRVCFELPFERPLRKNRQFDVDTMRQFASEFSVTRTLRWSKKDEKTAECERVQFVQFLNNLPHQVAASNLKDQFNEIVECVESSPGSKCLWKRQNFPSALSKFWMVRTDWRWPPFDRYAARAVGINGKSAIDRATSYYCHLDNIKFDCIVKNINCHLPESSLLRAERIFDKFLILEDMPYIQALAHQYYKTQNNDIQGQWKEAATNLKDILTIDKVRRS